MGYCELDMGVWKLGMGFWNVGVGFWVFGLWFWGLVVKEGLRGGFTCFLQQYFVVRSDFIQLYL